MRAMITGLASAALLLAIASPSAAQRDHYYPRDNSPSSTAERQRHVRTFDPKKYHERQLDKIPMGTQAWWDQLDRERGRQ